MTLVCLYTSEKEAFAEERVFDVKSVEAIEFIRRKGISLLHGEIYMYNILCTLLERDLHAHLLAGTR